MEQLLSLTKMHVCCRLNITFFKELVTRYVHVSLSLYMYFWLAVYSTYNNSSFHLSWSLFPIEDKFLDKKHVNQGKFEYRISSNKRPRSNKRPPQNKQSAPRPKYQSEAPLSKKAHPPPPPFPFHFLTSVNRSDTRKTCFYNFLSFNFNIYMYTDTSEFKVENGTTGHLITNGC